MSLDSVTKSVDESVSGFVEPLAKWLGEVVFYSVPANGTEIPLIVAWLVVAGLVFTTWFGFVQVRKFRLASTWCVASTTRRGRPARSTTSRR